MDKSEAALKRQINILHNLNYKNNTIERHVVDFSKKESYQNILMKHAPYDFIISANLLTELFPNDIEQLLSEIPDKLNDGGLLLIAEAPRLYTTKLSIKINKMLKKAGLFQYYPCPPRCNCKQDRCWVWFETEFKCPNIKRNKVQIKISDILKTTWILFSKANHSIYDHLQKDNAGLDWGIAVPLGREFSNKTELKYTVCTDKGRTEFIHTRKNTNNSLIDSAIRRGSIIGFKDNFTKPELAWHPLYKYDDH